MTANNTIRTRPDIDTNFITPLLPVFGVNTWCDEAIEYYERLLVEANGRRSVATESYRRIRPQVLEFRQYQRQLPAEDRVPSLSSHINQYPASQQQAAFEFIRTHRTNFDIMEVDE